MGIKVDDICFLYERGTAMQVNALDHITVDIPEDQFIGLIGHTGSGKSTFVQTLNGLLKVTYRGRYADHLCFLPHGVPRDHLHAGRL